MYRSRRTASAIARKVMWARSRPVRVVAGSLLVGKLLRLGPHLFEAPITAMLLLEVGATGGLGASRVGEAIVGAVVGIAVSVLVAPPLYVQPAGEAIGEL